MKRNPKKQRVLPASQWKPVLTRREREVMRLLVKGLRNRAIGEKLSISEGTVKVHLHAIFEKLNVESRVELIVHARTRGLR